MIAVLILLACLLFAGLAIAVARVLVEREKLASYKRVGDWFEHRVAELENENRQLAEQLVVSGAVKHLAMPLPPREPDVEYAYDPTGLVREVLDPRDVPSHL